jgi:putative hydroxymethylpyrimidine transporter CytX
MADLDIAQPLAAPRDDLGAATVGVERVPEAFRVLGFFDHFVLWADLGVGLLVLQAGSYLVPGLGLPQAIAAVLIGTLIGNAMLSLAGWIGAEHAVPSMVGLRPSFGLRGSYIPSFINVVQLIGWGAFEIVIMARAAATLSGPILGHGSYPIWVFVWGGVAVLLGLGGPLVVVRQWLEKFGIWLVLLTVSWMAVYTLGHASLGAIWSKPGDGSTSFAQAIDLVVAMPISWLPLVADFNRFARDPRSSAAGTFFGFAVSNVLCYLLGVLLILTLPAGDLIGSIMTVAFGGWGLALLLGDETDNAFADIYSSAISVKNVIPGLPTRWLVAVLGAVCLAIALTVDLSSFQNFLLLVGSLFTPLFGVLFADRFLVRRRRYTDSELYPSPMPPAANRAAFWGVNLIALVAWGAGLATYLAETTWVVWLGGTLPSLAVSLAVYVAFTKAAARFRSAG